MTDAIEDLKRQIRARLPRDFRAVPPKTQTSQKKHLEVWETAAGKTHFVGFEFDRKDFLNSWLATINVPAMLPDTIKRTDKSWEGGRHVGVVRTPTARTRTSRAMTPSAARRLPALPSPPWPILADAELIIESLVT